MGDKIYLTEMTKEIAEVYFRGFVIDPVLFPDDQPIKEFQYSDQWLAAYLQRNKECIRLAIMRNEDPIGEILLKRIDPSNRTAVLSIHLQNDSIKNKGYGTIAEILAIEYAFNIVGFKTIYADAIKNNKRSINVLNKVGFQFIKEDENFLYFELHNAKYDPKAFRWPAELPGRTVLL